MSKPFCIMTWDSLSGRRKRRERLTDPASVSGLEFIPAKGGKGVGVRLRE
jgi:hypothetical protein